MGLAAFNRMRREQAEREAKEQEEEEDVQEKPINKMTVNELREKLSSLGVNAEESAKKAELISLLESVLLIDSKQADQQEDIKQNGDESTQDESTEQQQPE